MIRDLASVLFVLSVGSVLFPGTLHAAESTDTWQLDWDKTLRAAEQEGQGLAVQILDAGNWKEAAGLDTIGGAYALMDRPAHPNAAKVLVNWLLSREGQIALQRDSENAGSIDSLRIDIPKSDVNPLMRRKDGVKYLEMWNPNWMNIKPVEELINQIMGEGKKN